MAPKWFDHWTTWAGPQQGTSADKRSRIYRLTAFLSPNQQHQCTGLDSSHWPKPGTSPDETCTFFTHRLTPEVMDAASFAPAPQCQNLSAAKYMYNTVLLRKVKLRHKNGTSMGSRCSRFLSTFRCVIDFNWPMAGGKSWTQMPA